MQERICRNSPRGFPGPKGIAFILFIWAAMALSALAQPEQTGLPGDPSYQGFSEGFNQAPLLVSLIPDRPAPQEAGTSVKWTALGQDPDGDPILYQFRLRGPSTGGVWQPVTGWSRDGTWEWRVSASDVGENQVGVWIRDGLHSDESGFDDQRTTDYQIVQAQPAVVAAQPEAAPNQPPAILEFGPDRGSPQEAGTTITWTATASDPDGDPILYRFLLNGAPVTDWQPEPQWTWSAEQPGESQITVQVRDGKHSEVDDTRSASFMIASPNQPPAISDLSADRASPQEAGTTITWTATASDPDGDPILYRFLLNGAPATDWQPEPQWTWSADQPGESQITVQVRDDMHPGPEGEMGNMSAMFTIVAPAPGNVTPPVTENITLPVEAENVTLIPENVTAPAVPAVENQTPVLNALIPNLPSPQAPGAAVVWSANATDADGDQILYRFFLSGPATGGSLQPMTDWVSASTWTWNTAAGDAGENQVRVAVRDGRHAAEDGYDAEQTVYFIIARPTRNITGSAFHDLNGNGRKDSGEALSGWMIQLSRDGSEVATITDDQGSYRFEGLEPGSYVVSEVLPSGWEAISPEGGSYSLELSETDAVDRDFSNRLTSYSISGMKFNDLNANGVNDGEPGIAGWSIQLSRDGGVVNATTTGQDGSYRFEGLAPGTYTVAEVEQSGWIRTAPKGGSYTVELKDSDVTGRDFGNRGSWSIAGSVFQDVNGDGSRGEDEPGIAGWSIQLSRDGGVVNATTTGQDGSYRFEGLAPGTYTVSEVLQEGFSQTVPQGPYTVELKDADVTGRDFGNRGNLTITGVKFYDANGNGLQEEDEPGIPGGSVSLIRDGAVLATTTTDEDGAYSFNNVLPGTYTISDPLPGGLVLTTSSTVVVTVKTSLVVKANFGVAGQYSISGVKYNDLNGNGARDAGEPGIAGWEMLLTGNLWFGKPIHARTAITASDGSYKFERLLPGTYKVSETSRTGWTQTAPSGGSYTVTFPFGSAPSESKNNDFGNRVPGQSISGVKYNDLNGNGARDSGEPGLAGWTINLEQPAGTVIQTKTTASDGSYIFTGLADGTYVVSEVLQTGWTQKAPAGGTYTVTLSPSSPSAIGKDFGNWIPGPTNPTLTSDKSSPQRAGTPIVWTAGATDPDGDPLQYRFFVRGPTPSHTVRADTGYSPSNTWTWSTIGYAPGTYSVEVWIRDGEHAGPGSYDVKKAVSFTLTSPNLPPVVSVLFADRPAPQVAGSWVKWTAIGFDPEGDPLQYRFFLRGPSTGGFWVDQTGWGKNNRWIWRTGPMDVGYSEVLVAVRDGKHSGPAGADDYSISGYYIINLNQPPVITGLGSSAPSPQPIGALVRWQATALDAEHNPVFYRYLLRGPSTGGLWRVVRDWSTDPSWTWATTLADAGTSEIRVHVRDGFHSGPAGWDDDVGALFTVLGPNQPPRLISLQPDRPSPQEAGAAVRWTARASDPERDPIL
ncbi:MAG: SdrD B-like domain-containing protein, partial [Methanothrix sp.]|nr:SdrD B-like domain-containing protein [Methanothrix sp.]